MAKIKVRRISPGGREYSEQFFSTMYSTHVAFADGERQLIWSRFSGFLVLEGLLIGALTRDFSLAPALLLMLLSSVGCVLSVVWFVLNYSGWMNQNQWLTYAARYNFERLELPLLSDPWQDTRSLRPFGAIYKVAQCIPSSFLAVYASVFGYSIFLLEQKLVWGITSAVVMLVACVIVTWLVAESIYRDRLHQEDDKPIN